MAPLPSQNSGDARRSSAAFAGIISSAFLHLPFSSVSIPAPPNQPHFALVGTADHFFKALAESLSGHPLARSLSTLHSRFQSFCQSHRRSPRIVTLPVAHSFAAVLPGNSVAGLVVTNGILSFLNLYNTLLVVRLVLTWFPNSPPAIVSPLSTICDPYLNLFRGIIPPLGGTLDLSPILAFLVLNAFTSTAAALPAELPPTLSQRNISLQHAPSGLTTMQEKWMRRMSGKRPKN